MLEKLPPDYQVHEVKDRLKKMGHLQPLNIFLKQEIDRMQRVISTVRTTLSDLKLAIDGMYSFSLGRVKFLDPYLYVVHFTEFKGYSKVAGKIA